MVLSLRSKMSLMMVAFLALTLAAVLFAVSWILSDSNHKQLLEIMSRGSLIIQSLLETQSNNLLEQVSLVAASRFD